MYPGHLLDMGACENAIATDAACANGERVRGERKDHRYKYGEEARE